MSYDRIDIMIRPVSDWLKVNASAIHVLTPTYQDIVRKIDDALKDGFRLIVVYVDVDRRAKMHNIFASNSTWNKLRRDFEDVRYGTLGPCRENGYRGITGEGFTLYIENGDEEEACNG